jgi:hypothetical protein
MPKSKISDKRTRKQRAVDAAREKRKIRLKMKSAGHDDVTDDMIQEKHLSSCVDRISGMLPRAGYKPAPSSQQKAPRRYDCNSIFGPWTSLPLRPLKKSVLWMTTKEQDATSTMTLAQELESFAEYISVRPIFSHDDAFMLDCKHL